MAASTPVSGANIFKELPPDITYALLFLVFRHCLKVFLLSCSYRDIFIKNTKYWHGPGPSEFTI